MRKKHILIILTLLLSAAFIRPFSLSAASTDWAIVTNEELRESFLNFTKTFRDQMKGELIYGELDNLIREVKAISEAEPFAWLNQANDFITAQLRRYPPTMSLPSSTEKNYIIRKNLLLMRDYPLHLNNSSSATPAPVSGQSAAYNNMVEHYLSGVRAEFMAWLDKPAPTEDGVLEIFKVYNCGYCLRTSKHTVLIDIRWDGTDKTEIEKIASKADIIFLTHNHSDHYSDSILKAMASAGKYIILPHDRVPSYSASGKYFVQIETYSEPLDCGGVKSQGFLGEQNGTPCFVYAIEFDGWRFAHGGDNQVPAMEEKLSHLEPFDVVTIAIFSRPQSIMGYTMQANENADSKRDLIFLSSHENEKSHDVAGRKGYNYAFFESTKFASSTFNYPSLVIWDNGEHITLKKLAP